MNEMSALSTILSPLSPLENRESIPLKREIEDEQPPTKRRKSTPPSLSPSVNGVREEKGDEEGVARKEKEREERKRKWLAGLTYRELLGVAQGAVWNSGYPHSSTCHTCHKPGTLLECHNCPRAYHRRCLDPPIHGNFKIDGVWYCPNCVLLLEDPLPGGLVNGVVVNERARATRGGGVGIVGEIEVERVTPLHREMKGAGTGSGGVEGRGRIPLPNRRLGLVSEDVEGRIVSAPSMSYRKSRYSTIAPEIDEALGLLNRELEQAAQIRTSMTEMKERLGVAQQESRIWKGRAELLVRERGLVRDGEEDREVDRLKSENLRLGKEVESLREEAVRKEREWEEWKGSMKRLVEGG